MKAMAALIERLIFQSSPSIQRETSIIILLAFAGSFQSSPSIQRETDTYHQCSKRSGYFNPLPLYRGRLQKMFNLFSVIIFQSSPSIQRETIILAYLIWLYIISILSLYTEGDNSILHLHTDYIQFQSSPSIQRET